MIRRDLDDIQIDADGNIVVPTEAEMKAWLLEKIQQACFEAINLPVPVEYGMPAYRPKDQPKVIRNQQSYPYPRLQ